MELFSLIYLMFRPFFSGAQIKCTTIMKICCAIAPLMHFFFFSYLYRSLPEKDAAQVLASNTDDASNPAPIPEVKAIASTATPDGAGSQTHEMGETSSDSDGGEDQD